MGGRRIEYFLTTASPWAYLGHAEFGRIAARHGATIVARPMPVRRLFDETGGLPLPKRHPVRQAYRLVELQRWRAVRGLPLDPAVSHSRPDPSLADRTAIAIAEQGGDPMPFLGKAMAGNWADRLDLADDVAGDVLNQMKTVPIEAPLQLLAELTASKPVEGTVLPDVTLPGGAIWPPLQGRVSLQEANSGEVSAPRELSPGEWLAESSSGWRFHSAAANVFDDADAARSALIEWAQLHAACGPVLSPHRCIAMVVDPDGRHRLWQVVRFERSLWNEAIDAEEAKAACRAAAERWAGAPVKLPCTLETVGNVDGLPTFVSLFPR